MQMRKLLLLLVGVLTSIGVWADVTFSGTNADEIVITTNGDADLSTATWPTSSPCLDGGGNSAFNSIKVVGDLTSTGLAAIISHFNQYGNGSYSATLDLSNVNATSLSFPADKGSLLQYINYLYLPKGIDVSSIDNSEWKDQYGNNSALKYIYGCNEDVVSFRIISGTYTADDVISKTPSAYGENISKYSISGPDASAVTTLENALKDAGKEIVVPFDGKATVTGGSVQTGVEAVLEQEGVSATEITDLTVSGGTLTDDDVTYITGTLTGVGTLDLSGTSLTASQLLTLLAADKVTALTVTAANITGWDEVSGKTITPAMLAKLNGLTAAGLAEKFTKNNYIVDGSTLIVTGEITSDVESQMNSLVSTYSITTLDVSNATNASAYEITAINGITTVSLPASGNVTYGGSAIKLVDGVLEVEVGTESAGAYASLEDLKNQLGTTLAKVKHLKITGTISDWSNFTSGATALGYDNLETIDLSGVTGITSDSNPIPSPTSASNTCILLPKGIDLSTITYNGNFNFFSLDKDNEHQLNVKANSAGQLANGAYFTLPADITILKAFDGTSASGAGGVKAMTAYESYSVDIVDLTGTLVNTSANDPDQLAAAKSELASVKTVLSPISGNQLVVDGPLTNSVLAALNSIADDNITSIDFSGATVKETLNWNSLTAFAKVDYVMLPASERDNLNALTGIQNLKATGVHEGTTETVNVIDSSVAEGAIHKFNETFSVGESTITRITALGTLNEKDVDFSSFASKGTIDLSAATISSDNLEKIKVSANNDASSCILILPDGMDYASLSVLTNDKLGMIGVAYSKSGTQLTAYVKYVQNQQLADMLGGVTGLTIGGMLNNDMLTAINGAENLTTLNIPALTSSLTNDRLDLDNQHLTTVNLSSLEATTVFVDVDGCSSLVTLDLAESKIKGASAQNITTLQSVKMNPITLPASYSHETGEGCLNVTGSLHDGLLISVPEEFDVANRIIPTLTEEQQEKYIDNSAGEMKDNDGCSISLENDVATVHLNTAGHLADLFSNKQGVLSQLYPAGTIFRFDESSKFGLNDLKAFFDYANGFGYYLDLFNLTATEQLCAWDDGTDEHPGGIIAQGIDWMRENDKSFRGLILPKDHTVWGAGTSLIQDGKGSNTTTPTCTEFIAYYKTKDESNKDLDQQLLVAHVYNAQNNHDYCQANFAKMMSILDDHSEIADNTDIYQISTNSKTQIDISSLKELSDNAKNAALIETYNNEMVSGVQTKATVYAYPAKAGDLAAAVTATGINNTDVDRLFVVGQMNSDDYVSINSFGQTSNGVQHKGPRVLNLSRVTAGLSQANLSTLTNKQIEYIVMPADADTYKGLVFNNAAYSNLTGEEGGLKAVILETNSDVVANVFKEGSLYEARVHANEYEPDDNGDYNLPGKMSKLTLTDVTLKGELNASDIAGSVAGWILDPDGHIYPTGSEGKKNEGKSALMGSASSITHINLTDAVFKRQDDMNFAAAGLTKLSEVNLPTSSQMNTIPASSFWDLTEMKYLLIPYNYQYIENSAFYLSNIRHITTTDSKGALIDNGENTITLSANIKRLGSDPSPDDHTNLIACGNGWPVFGAQDSKEISDIYVLATTPPICYRGVFPAGMTYGWNGYDPGEVFCRDKYVNNGFKFTLLHYPDQGSMSDEEYKAMEKLYTDVTKVYTKKDQTGAVDANGETIPWPTQSELVRSWNQAIRNAIWKDWTITDLIQKVGNIEGGALNENAAEKPESVTSTNVENPDHYDFYNYIGWHEFVLTKATYVAPVETVKEDVVYREYEDAGWFTFCIPFDMTRDEVIQLMGVPASTTTVKTKKGSFTFDADGKETSGGYNEEAILPDIRTLKAVERSPEAGNSSAGKITLRLTKNLAESADYWVFDSSNNEGGSYQSNARQYGESTKSDILIRGGYPYFIKAYRRKGESFTNLGKTILSRYEFSMMASSIYREGCYVTAGTNISGLAGSKFVSPYEGHQVQASLNTQEGGYAYLDNNEATPYYYRFIGQFWKQPLPVNSYYFSESKQTWYYYNSKKEGYNWNPYKCIINVSMDRDATLTVIPDAVGTDSKGNAVFDTMPQVGYGNGRDDSFGSSAKQYVFSFDDGITDLGTDGVVVTAIDRIDGADLLPAATRVYNLNGQFVGTSTEGLAKGLYVVNGKKIIVK